MQQLLDAVKQVKQTIQAHKPDLMNNEALTRYALVDVILNALGWDVHNPAKVFPEYNKGVGGGRADYALLDTNSKPIAILEAKKLSNLTTNDLIQVTTYAFHSGIKYSLATDGNIWIVADAYKQVQFSDKEIMRLSLETEPENLLLIKLVSLMSTNLCAGNDAFFPTMGINASPLNLGQPVNISSVSSNHSVNSTRSSTKTSHKLAALVSNPDANSKISTEWIPLSKIAGAANPPKEIKFPDGTTVSTGSRYSGVLKQIAEWLIHAKKLPRPPIEDASKGKMYLVNTTPVHKNGANFRNESSLSNGWFLDTHYNSSNCIKNALWLLQLAGENPDDYYFQ